jgi:hypothetical protein
MLKYNEQIHSFFKLKWDIWFGLILIGGLGQVRNPVISSGM